MEREFNLCCGAEQSSAETTPGSTWGCLGSLSGAQREQQPLGGVSGAGGSQWDQHSSCSPSQDQLWPARDGDFHLSLVPEFITRDLLSPDCSVLPFNSCPGRVI